MLHVVLMEMDRSIHVMKNNGSVLVKVREHLNKSIDVRMSVMVRPATHS